GVIAATPLYKLSPESGWQAFTQRYESTYRRTLNSELPALGYDAVRLLIQALGRDRPAPGDVAQRVSAISDLRGATGILSVQDRVLVRRPYLVRIEGGELIPLGAHVGPGVPPPSPIHRHDTPRQAEAARGAAAPVRAGRREGAHRSAARARQAHRARAAGS